MNVGDEHRALPQPMKCALGVQRDALATHDGVEHAVVGARRHGCVETKEEGHENEWSCEAFARPRVDGAQSEENCSRARAVST